MEIVLGVWVVGALGGTAAGLVGIGGGIILFPLLAYGLPALGLPALSVRTITGLTIVQALAAGGAGLAVHRKRRTVSTHLVVCMGSGSIIGSFLGGYLSRYLGQEALNLIFAALALSAATAMIIPVREISNETKEHLEERRGAETAPTAGVPHSVVDKRGPTSPLDSNPKFNRKLAFATALVLGLATGTVGQGGSFILIPVMIRLLKIPTRVSMGSNLGIVLLAALGGFTGKLVTGQIDWSLAGALVAGALPGGRLGAVWAGTVPTESLRNLFAALVGLAAGSLLIKAVF
ncbi:MAG: sulfite exporter TauE/SafE family protein [Firmicutes bacterium]|nr:sulfite exporter TauE/SafE family protein [Bacillota bacterium]